MASSNSNRVLIYGAGKAYLTQRITNSLQELDKNIISYPVTTKYYSAELRIELINNHSNEIKEDEHNPIQAVVLLYNVNDPLSFDLCKLAYEESLGELSNLSVQLIVGNQSSASLADEGVTEQLITSVNDWAVDNQFESIQLPYEAFTSDLHARYNSLISPAASQLSLFDPNYAEASGWVRVIHALQANLWRNISRNDKNSINDNIKSIAKASDNESKKADESSVEEAELEEFDSLMTEMLAIRSSAAGQNNDEMRKEKAELAIMNMLKKLGLDESSSEELE
jgi:hypothetical protein